MNWLPTAFDGTRYVSDCGQYELHARWSATGYAWRGRVIATDVLVQSSADRSYVELCCERHAAMAMAEAV